MNVSLTPELERYVRRKVGTGLYNNASEVIREALRLLVSREGDAGGRARQPSPRKGDVLAQLAGLEKALRERGIQSAALFGSVVRGTARADSDIDVLVDVAPGSRFSLVEYRGRHCWVRFREVSFRPACTAAGRTESRDHFKDQQAPTGRAEGRGAKHPLASHRPYRYQSRCRASSKGETPVA